MQLQAVIMFLLSYDPTQTSVLHGVEQTHLPEAGVGFSPGNSGGAKVPFFLSALPWSFGNFMWELKAMLQIVPLRSSQKDWRRDFRQPPTEKATPGTGVLMGGHRQGEGMFSLKRSGWKRWVLWNCRALSPNCYGDRVILLLLPTPLHLLELPEQHLGDLSLRISFLSFFFS